MYLEDAALCVNQRKCALNLIGGTQDRRFNLLIAEGGFHEMVKIRCDDDFYESLCGQCRDGAVCRRRLFFALLTLQVVRFPIPTEQLLSFGRRLVKFVEKARSNLLCVFQTSSYTNVPGGQGSGPNASPWSFARLRIKSSVISQPVGIPAALDTPEPTRTA